MPRPSNQDIMNVLGELKTEMGEIKTVVLGKNSDKGLVGWVADIEKIVTNHGRLIYIIIGILSVGGTTAGLVSWLS